MSLSRQLILLVSLLFALVFAGTFVITADNTRRYLATQLESHAQDTATSLALSLSPHLANDDVLLMESMVDAIFDRGYYREIVVEAVDGSRLITRELPIKVYGVPDWFVRWLPLVTPKATAKLMAGWRQGGEVHVTSHPGHAYGELWENMVETFWWSLASFALAILFTSLVIRFILVPLRGVERQALAIADREFPRQEKIPRTRELRRVVLAMNKMTGKVEEMLTQYHDRAERLRESTYVDPLTGLGNQQAFDRELDSLVSQREEHAFGAVLLVRVSGLDEANRAGGYGGGDAFLRAVATELKARVEEEQGTATRLAGSLFGVLIPDITRTAVGGLMDELIRVTTKVAVDGLQPTGVNVGLAYYGGGQSTTTLRERAEAALQNAAKSGSRAWHMYDATETAGGADVHHEKRWREILGKVIDERAIVLLFQPVKSADLSRLFHYEVLARIRGHGGELISAGLFFPMAARVGLTVELDKLIIDAALEAIGRDREAGERFAINLSRQSVSDTAFVEWLAERLKARGTIAARLFFEVTEQLAVRTPDVVLHMASRLRALGANFGVDHCGARDLALDYMKQLKADYTKIDGAFIKGLSEDAEKQAYVKSLVEFGHALDFRVIAEYVENDADLEIVTGLGFDGVQGHHVGMPEES